MTYVLVHWLLPILPCGDNVYAHLRWVWLCQLDPPMYSILWNSGMVAKTSSSRDRGGQGDDRTACL